MKWKSAAAFFVVFCASLAHAGDNYTTVGVILDNKVDAIKKVQDCLKKVGVKDVSIETNSPNPAIHVLKTQADKARKALKKSGLRILIYERKKK